MMPSQVALDKEIKTRATQWRTSESKSAGTLSDHLHFMKQQFCYNIQYLKSFHIFVLALTVSKILTLQIV